MKKLILVFLASVFVTCAYTQIDSVNRKTNPPDINNTNNGLNQDRDVNPDQDLNKNQNPNVQNNQVDKTLPDGVLMQNGKVVKVKNGQTTKLDNDITMSNGTRVMSDGTFIKKDGTKSLLKEGQQMDMSGNLVMKTTQKDKNMYLVPDSSKIKNN